MQSPTLPLSVVVIGRNESEHLSRLCESLERLRAEVECEFIYVDSASTDNSTEIAVRLFDLTIELAPSENLNASAGRFAGVQSARGEWVLFLDGDMALMPEAVPALMNHVRQAPHTVGAVGDYIYLSGQTQERRIIMGSDAHGRGARFGGAVLLSHQVLQTCNWNPRLFANEEVELYTRLCASSYGMQHLHCNLIQHHTDDLTFKQKLVGNFVPRKSFLGKKFFGFGQVLHARFESGTLWTFVRHYPDPFVFWLGLLVAMLCFLMGSIGLGLLVGAVTLIYVGARTSIRSVVAYLGYLPQAIYGWPRYASGWEPAVLRKLPRDTTVEPSRAHP